MSDRDRCHPRRHPQRRARRGDRGAAAPGDRAGRAGEGRRAGDVRRPRVRREGPAQVDPRRGVPAARARAGRGVRGRDGVGDQLQHGVDVDLRAAADVRVPEAPRPRERVGQASRPAVPRDGIRREWCRVAGGLRGAQLEAGRRRHGALPARRRPGPVRARRLDDGDEPAHLGVRDELRRPRRDRGREGEPAHAEARAPHVGRGGVQRAVQLHELPHDRQPERLADDAGPVGAGVGRDRRHRRVRGAVRDERRRHAGRCGVVGEARRAAARDGLRGGHRPAGRGLQVLERRRHRAGPGGVAAVRQEDPQPRSAATSTSCSNTPVVRRWARRCSSPSAAG